MESCEIRDEASGWIISYYTPPLRAVQVTALPSFCGVLILSVSLASPTPCLIGSTLWVFYHGTQHFSRIGPLDIFRSRPSGPLCVLLCLCGHAMRSGRELFLVKSRVQTSHGGREGLVAVFVRQLCVAADSRVVASVTGVMRYAPTLAHTLSDTHFWRSSCTSHCATWIWWIRGLLAGSTDEAPTLWNFSTA